MEEKITLCGDNCMACPRYHARSDEERERVAKLWYKVGWRDRIVSNEEIACEGCSSHKECTYHLIACTEAHKVAKCNQCSKFPCERITDMLNRSKEYEKVCEKVCSTDDYYMLKQAFFEKEKNLKRE